MKEENCDYDIAFCEDSEEHKHEEHKIEDIGIYRTHMKQLINEIT